MKFDNNIKMTLIIFVIICFAIYYLRPSIMFDEDRTFKQFGLTKDRTIYPFWLVLLVIGIIVYLCIIIRNDEYI